MAGSGFDQRVELDLSGPVRVGDRPVLAVLFSRAETWRRRSGGPIDKLSVVFVAVIAVLFLREKLSGMNWLGVVMITAGVILVSYKA